MTETKKSVRKEQSAEDLDEQIRSMEADRISLGDREKSDESPEDGGGDGAWMLMEGQRKGVA